MLRCLLTAFLIAGLVFTGCSKKEEKAKALEKEAAESEGAITDSVGETGLEAETPSSTVATSQKKPTGEPFKSVTDLSGLEGYVVQIGSYADKNLAQSMAEKYQGRDFPAFVQAVTVNNKVLYRLRVGVYESMAEAKQVGEILKDRYSVDYWIDRNQ